MTFSNEERQLRLGLGHVLRYRQVLGRHGRQVVGVLAAYCKDEPCPPRTRRPARSPSPLWP